MAVSASVVANKFLRLAQKSCKNLTHLQLQKLVYLANGWSLGLNNAPLIHNTIEAWQYGPVIPDLYRQLRDYKNRPVTDFVSVPMNEKLSKKEEEIIERTYATYKDYTAYQLVDLTHQEGTPWAQIIEESGEWEEIPECLIKEHYQKKLDKNKA